MPEQQTTVGDERAATARDRIGQSLLSFRERLARQDAGAIVGTFLIELPNVATIRILAMAGFSFVVVDLEHSTLNLATAEPLLAEARACGLSTLVRVPPDQLSLIGNALDAGANGVMVPHVDSVEQAERVVRHARFAPVGERGFSPLTIARSLDTPQSALNRGQIVVVQIEGRAGIANAGDIANVAGIDAVFVGPYDLAEALGTPSDIDSVAVMDAAERIARSVPEGGLVGIYMDDPAKSTGWAKRGFRLQCVSFDGQMLANRAREVIRATEWVGDSR